MAVMSTGGRLEEEIASLKSTLLALDQGEKPVDTVKEHKTRITSILNSPDAAVFANDSYYPIHELLSVPPLTTVIIPLDILGLLLHKYDVNEHNGSGMTCLNLAVENTHFNAVRFLIEKDADSRLKSPNPDASQYRPISAIALLASKPHVPLDLFTLLATEETLNGVGMFYFPLHIALQNNNIASARHLIQLGSNTNIRDGCGIMPIEYYERTVSHEYHKDLFCSLIPSSSLEVLRSVCRLLGLEIHGDGGVRCQMMYDLLQRLLVSTSATVAIHATVHRDYRCIDMTLNEELIVKPSFTFKAAYLSSVLLLMLDYNIVSTPHVIAPYLHGSATEEDRGYARAIDTVWQAYLRKPRTKSLLTLCIQKTRACMNSLQESSFELLPVPAYIRSLLKYQNVAGAICEALLLWPECKTL